MLASRILIVECNDALATDLERRVTSFGYRVVGRAVSGPEALERAASLRPELVLTEVRLNGPMDGIEAAQALRKKFGIPVVYLTGSGDKSTISRAMHSEPQGYLLKPVEDGSLRAALAIAFSRQVAETRVRASERLLDCLLNSLKDPTISTDLEGRILFMNSAAAVLAGCAVHEGMGKPFPEVFRVVDERTGDKAELSMVDALSCRSAPSESRGKLLLGPDGRRIVLQDSATLMRDGMGSPVGMVIELRDAGHRLHGEGDLRHRASTDDLTGLWNRRRFLEQLTLEVTRSQRFGSPLCVALLDVDHFKAVNDTFGHDAGDRVLARLSTILQEELRDTDLIGRLGGDEFVMALPETKEDEAEIVLNRLVTRIGGEALETVRAGTRVTVSIGLAAYDAARHDVAGLIKSSDEAVYQAKSCGRNRLWISQPLRQHSWPEFREERA